MWPYHIKCCLGIFEENAIYSTVLSSHSKQFAIHPSIQNENGQCWTRAAWMRVFENQWKTVAWQGKLQSDGQQVCKHSKPSLPFSCTDTSQGGHWFLGTYLTKTVVVGGGSGTAMIYCFLPIDFHSWAMMSPPPPLLGYNQGLFLWWR